MLQKGIVGGACEVPFFKMQYQEKSVAHYEDSGANFFPVFLWPVFCKFFRFLCPLSFSVKSSIFRVCFLWLLPFSVFAVLLFILICLLRR